MSILQKNIMYQIDGCDKFTFSFFGIKFILIRIIKDFLKIKIDTSLVLLDQV